MREKENPEGGWIDDDAVNSAVFPAKTPVQNCYHVANVRLLPGAALTRKIVSFGHWNGLFDCT